jgi:hypothetical protein
MIQTLPILAAALAAALAAQEPKKVIPDAGQAPPGDAAPVKSAIPAGGAAVGQPNAWFPVVDRDLGTFFNHEQATGRFAFQNPKAEALVWKLLTASCQCSGATITVGERRYELRSKPQANALYRVAVGKQTEDTKVTQIEVGPKEAGEVEVHMEMHGIVGPKQASIAIHTTDAETPMINLSFRATGAQMFVVTPGDVSLNQMTWNEKREFSVSVTSPVQKDFTITRMDEPGKDFKVAYEKDLKDGVATWTIRGTYGPVSDEPGGGGVLKFYTDLKGDATFTVRVSATVRGPLEVTPGTFLSLGMIRKGSKKLEKVVFEPNDGTDLAAGKIRIEGLTVDPQYVTTHTSKDGNKLVVELEVSADAPKGLLRGDLVVELNHPVIKEKKILFNGFIR